MLLALLLMVLVLVQLMGMLLLGEVLDHGHWVEFKHSLDSLRERERI